MSNLDYGFIFLVVAILCFFISSHFNMWKEANAIKIRLVLMGTLAIVGMLICLYRQINH